MSVEQLGNEALPVLDAVEIYETLRPKMFRLYKYNFSRMGRRLTLIIRTTIWRVGTQRALR